MKLPMILKLTAKAIDVNDIFVDISVASAPKLRKCCWTHAMLWKRHLHPHCPLLKGHGGNVPVIFLMSIVPWSQLSYPTARVCWFTVDIHAVVLKDW